VAPGSFRWESHRALANQQISLSDPPRPGLPNATALLNIGCRSPRADVTSAGWKCLGARDAFPRANSFDDDINSGQRGVDLALHVFDLRLQKFLHFVEFGS